MRDSRTEIRASRVAGAILLSCFLIAQVFAAAHSAMVRHVLCPVHGELVHGDHEHGASSASTNGGEDSSAPALCAAANEEGHSKHCSVVLLSKQRTALFHAQSVRLAVSAASEQTGSLRSHADGIGIAVFLYAPKQSPPHEA